MNIVEISFVILSGSTGIFFLFSGEYSINASLASLFQLVKLTAYVYFTRTYVQSLMYLMFIFLGFLEVCVFKQLLNEC